MKQAFSPRLVNGIIALHAVGFLALIFGLLLYSSLQPPQKAVQPPTVTVPTAQVIADDLLAVTSAADPATVEPTTEPGSRVKAMLVEARETQRACKNVVRTYGKYMSPSAQLLGTAKGRKNGLLALNKISAASKEYNESEAKVGDELLDIAAEIRGFSIDEAIKRELDEDRERIKVASTKFFHATYALYRYAEAKKLGFQNGKLVADRSSKLEVKRLHDKLIDAAKYSLEIDDAVTANRKKNIAKILAASVPVPANQ